MELYLTISLFLALCALGAAMPAEPVCSSFDFQFKTLETMLRTEQSVQRLNEDTRSKHESIGEDLNKFKLELTTEFDKLKVNTAKQLSEKQEQLNLLTTQAEERLQKFNLLTTQGEERLQKFNFLTTQAEERLQKFNLLTTQAEERLQKFNLLTTQGEERLQSVDDAVTAMKNRDLTVAFSVARPTKSFVKKVPTFKTTITNIGGAYNMATGVFTSPVDGLYMFVFTVQSHGKYDVYCYIKHNGNTKAFARSNSDSTYTSASTSVYLLLTKGDTVTPGSCATGNWDKVYAGNTYDTAFSGALIKQTSVN